MALCPLCESEVPEGRISCPACGQIVTRPLTTHATPGAVGRALDSARKDLLAAANGRVDVSFARGLVERAEQTEAAGDSARALDLARAARRTVELAKTRHRVQEALVKAEGVLKAAKESGIETTAFERTITQARALAARGDPAGADKFLRRLSVKALDQRRERVLQEVLEKAKRRVSYARERGGAVSDAEALLADAREALALRQYPRIRELTAKAIEKAEAARKFARAEAILENAVAEVNAARETGVNITDSRRHLTQAREALRRGIYADVQSLALQTRQGLREARRRAQAEQVLAEAERELTREKRKGADVARGEMVFGEAEKALEGKDYTKVRSLAKDIHDAVREAALLKHVHDAIASLQLDAQDLRAMGADPSEFESILEDLKATADRKDLAGARRLVAHARHAAEVAREAHYRMELERSLRIILANASRGLDPDVARQLLREADDAISLGKTVDLQAMIDSKLASADAELEKSLNFRVTAARDDIVLLRQAGHNTTAMEGKLADAAIALQERRYLTTDGLLDAVEHDVHATRETLRSAAAEALGKARGAVEQARSGAVQVDPAILSLLKEAESAYSESRYGDAVYISNSCLSEVEQDTQAAIRAQKEATARTARERADRLQALRDRMTTLRHEIDTLSVQHVDLQRAMDALERVEEAIRKEDLEAAEQQVAVAEGIVEGVKLTLHHQATEAIEHARKLLTAAREQGFATPEMEASLSEAERHVAEGQPSAALEVVAALEQTLDQKRFERSVELQRQTFEKAQSAAAKFITVKKLIEDLRKADIDITGAEESLGAAERALEQKAFDDVDKILADLDATAKDLMDELIAAAKAMIERAEKSIQEGRGKGLDVGEAVELLTRGEGHFQKAEYAEAAECARAAEKKVLDAIKSVEEKEAAERGLAKAAAEAEIAGLRKTIADLARADITILQADQALVRAEAAYEAGRYADVPRDLADIKEMAAGLTLGLEVAAKDLVSVAEHQIVDARTSGVDPGRADMVLLNAHEAIEDGRFVEAIEYKKVIEDILVDATRAHVTRKARDQLSEYRARIDAYAKLGADVRAPTELLAKVEERIAHGDTEDLGLKATEIDVAIEAAGKNHLDLLVASFTPLISEGVELGLARSDLEEVKVHASEAASANDLEGVYRLKGDLQEKVLDAKRRSLMKRSEEEVEGLEDTLVQSERLGIPVEQARTHLDEARRAVETGDAEGFHTALTATRSALEDARHSHFVQRYETRVHSVSAMIANAKRLGAEIGEAEAALNQAEEALRRNDLSMADILVKQAEMTIGIQISNFIKNRYPNLVLHLPTTGLQANVWNRYVFEAENRGKLPARNVEFSFQGDVETKGTQPIPELGVGESKLVEVGVKPKAAGSVPMDVIVGYQRTFDENRYELKEKETLDVAEAGTYLVEDVFLIHSDGRLISHESRKFREEIDEDIFSGMLTVVQDFIKDSFKARTRVGMKRLDFGDSKILIERSPHTFLATVVLGREPKLLPLYMVQILTEIEGKYGPVLEKWTGLLHELQGIDDVIKKLLSVAQDPNADMGELSSSPVTLTAKVIDALGAAQTMEANELLAKAQSTLETDIQLAWQMIGQAKMEAEVAQDQLQSRMGDLLAAARDTVQEMKGIGADTSQAEMLLRGAEEAYSEKKYDRVREIHQSLHESLERAKGEIAAKRMEIELASLINDIQIAKSQNLDVREAESYLTKIENAIQKRNYRQMEDYLRRAKESLARQRRHTVLSKAREELTKLQATVAEAKKVRADLGDVEVLLQKAEAALKAEDLKDLEPLVDRAEATLKARVEQILKDRYPRLFLETSSGGLQARRWNRFELRIENKGDWPAQNVVPTVNGPAEVQGLRVIDDIEPNQKVSIEFGIRPKDAGTMDLDFEVHYTRPLDEAKHEVTDSTVVRVEAEGGYGVDDAVLFHSNGMIVCHESRTYHPPGEANKAAGVEAEAETLVGKAFAGSQKKGLARAAMGDHTLLAIRGTQAHVVLAVRGKEAKALPLYATQVLREIHDSYGVRLDMWSGDLSLLPGIQDVVRKLLFATEAPGVSLGPLEDTPVSMIPSLQERGLLGGKGSGFVEEAVAAIEAKGFEGGTNYLVQIESAAKGPTEEISTQIQKAVLAVKEAGTLQLTDEQVASYVDVLRRTLEATFQAKQRAGIERYWPISRLAIKANDALSYDAISAFRKIIVSQSGAKELDIVAPGDAWRGMRIDIDVHMDSVSAAYRLWAKKIEILLRSQDAWKIKAGLDKGEYSVGIEGQKVRIDPSMVSFVESLPDHVIEEPFNGGIAYLDTRMSKDLLAEGYAREIVNIVKDSRREMHLSEDSVVDVDVVSNADLRSMLRPWRDLILREANALEVRFTAEAPKDAYVVEAILGEAKLYLGIKQAQM
ncbi:MAG TPA: DUF5915 domain-containing protein [Thermoplasmata archaeon]